MFKVKNLFDYLFNKIDAQFQSDQFWLKLFLIVIW